MKDSPSRQMPPLFTPELKFGLPCLAAALSCYDANSRFDAANALFGRYPFSSTGHGGTELPNPRSFRISDLMALSFAAIILAVFEFLHRTQPAAYHQTSHKAYTV